MKYNNNFLQSVLEGYINCALWVTFDEPENEDAIYSESMDNIKKDVIYFLNNAPENNIEPQQLGHDLFLTRNGHGAGFWDRYLDETDVKLRVIAKDLGYKLTTTADSMGTVDVFIQDGFIYIE